MNTDFNIRSSILLSAAIGRVPCGPPRRNALHLHLPVRAMCRTTLARSQICTGSSTASKCTSPTVVPMQPRRFISCLKHPRTRLCPYHPSHWPWVVVCRHRRGGERDEGGSNGERGQSSRAAVGMMNHDIDDWNIGYCSSVVGYLWDGCIVLDFAFWMQELEGFGVSWRRYFPARPSEA